WSCSGAMLLTAGSFGATRSRAPCSMRVLPDSGKRSQRPRQQSSPRSRSQSREKIRGLEVFCTVAELVAKLTAGSLAERATEAQRRFSGGQEKRSGPQQ